MKSRVRQLKELVKFCDILSFWLGYAILMLAVSVTFCYVSALEEQLENVFSFTYLIVNYTCGTLLSSKISECYKALRTMPYNIRHINTDRRIVCEIILAGNIIISSAVFFLSGNNKALYSVVCSIPLIYLINYLSLKTYPFEQNVIYNRKSSLILAFGMGIPLYLLGVILFFCNMEEVKWHNYISVGVFVLTFILCVIFRPLFLHLSDKKLWKVIE